jgi:hypothetical protein
MALEAVLLNTIIYEHLSLKSNVIFKELSGTLYAL